MKKGKVKWVLTGRYLTVFYGEQRPCVLEKGTEKFNKVFKLLKENSSLNEIKEALDLKESIKKYSELEIKDSVVYIDKQPINDVISKKILQFYNESLPYQPLIEFWRNIQQNPSEESKKHLFLFLDSNKMPITDDGCFLAYKYVHNVEGRLVDCYTKTICNDVGKIVTYPREKVNPNRNATCSEGLHVAAWSYVDSNCDNRTKIEVKVNPRDVVAVPNDYNNQKMRVCRYEVMKVCTKQTEKTYINTGTNSKVSLKNLTAAKIVELVKKLTKYDIKGNLKNLKDKKTIIKRAIKALFQYEVEV